jgi:hypothetical protein
VPLVPENITTQGPDRHQDVHNSGVDTQLAPAHPCGQTDLRTGRITPSRLVTTGRASSCRKAPCKPSPTTPTGLCGQGR